MQSQTLELVVAESHLPQTESDALRSAFAPLFQQASDWAAKVATISVTDVSQTREMKLARESRLALKEIRCNSDRVRKKLKEESLRKGKAIDGMHNIIAFLTEPLEQKLLEMEQFVERKEEASLDERLKERAAALAYYQYNAVDSITLRALSDEAFDGILESARLIHEKRLAEEARLEQEKAAKAKAEAEERERVRLENERLKAENAKREAELKAQREAQAKAEQEHQAALDRQRREQEAQQQKLREENARKLAAEKAKAEAERAARRKAEAEIAAQREAERVRMEQEAKQKALDQFAPERVKLEAFLSQLSAVTLPTFTSEIGQRASRDLSGMKSQFETAVQHYISKL